MTDYEKQITELKAENAFLRQLLKEAGIPVLLPVKDPERLFISYFHGRNDVWARRVENQKTSKPGWYPQCWNFWTDSCPKVQKEKISCTLCPEKNWKPVERETVQDHLYNDLEAGIYPLGKDGKCRLLVFDFDGKNDKSKQWKEQAAAVYETCQDLHIPCLLEQSRSGQGIHLWIFFSEAVPARYVRELGNRLLERTLERASFYTLDAFDRFLPMQEKLQEQELGSLIALPLKNHSCFLDQNWKPVAHPLSWLQTIEKVSGPQLSQILEKLQKENTPWEDELPFRQEDVQQAVQIVLADGIYVQKQHLTPRMQNQIRRMAAIANPVYYRNQQLHLSNYHQSRYIYLGEDVQGFIHLPIGLLEQLTKRLTTSFIPYTVEDKRMETTPLQCHFNGELKDFQKPAFQAMTEQDNGILSAATAFGKTAVSCALLCEKKQRTLILVQSSGLISQWKEALERFVVMDEPKPVYVTKKGQKRTRSSWIGIIHGNKNTAGGLVDIAMLPTLANREDLPEFLHTYGLILMDECHHAAADTFIPVLQKIRAKFIYGVTATPFRSDGRSKINTMLLGPVRYTYSSKDHLEETGLPHYIIPRYTRTVLTRFTGEETNTNDAYEAIRKDKTRDALIMRDAESVLQQGRSALILTKHKDHAARLAEKAKGLEIPVFLLTGDLTRQEHLSAVQDMKQLPLDQPMLLVGTGSLIGEGFDLPRLDTLFLAAPISWKGRVEQFAGRLHRSCEGKQEIQIYDYIDVHIPVFHKMYQKRLKTYRKMDYEILLPGTDAEPSQASVIYDLDTFRCQLETDWKQAKQEVILSAPALCGEKVDWLIQIAAEAQTRGVQFRVLTPAPDDYGFGDTEYWMYLQNRLKNAGILIQEQTEFSPAFAVIDRKLVWHGTLNFLGRESVEEFMLRIESEEAALELLEAAFR